MKIEITVPHNDTHQTYRVELSGEIICLDAECQHYDEPVGYFTDEPADGGEDYNRTSGECE